MTTYPNPRNRFMPLFGAAILVAVGLWYGFLLVDTAGLEERDGEAVVTGREFREASTTYRTEKIGNQTRTLPIAVPAGYFVTFDLGGKPVTCEVPQDRYESLAPGARARIRYKRLRLRGHLQGTRVLEGPGG